MTDVTTSVCDDPDRSEFDTRVIDQSFEIYIAPELARRERTDDPRSITQFLVEISVDGNIRTLLDDEAESSLLIYIKREDDGLQYFDEVRPAEGAVHPDSAWVCFFSQPGGGGVLGFDYRKNRAVAQGLVDKAEKYLALARKGEDAHLSAALDNAHSAAELSVQALMMLENGTTQNHAERRKWLKMWADCGNSPAAHSDLMDNLAALRKVARYSPGDPPLKKGRFPRICNTIQEMIDVAKSVNGPSPSPINRPLASGWTTRQLESDMDEDTVELH